MSVVIEGKAKINIFDGKISKKLEVFYNPVMKLNRDLSILLLNTIDKKNLQIADPLAASGIRSIRFLKELAKGKIKNISLNDNDKNFIETIKNNLKLNDIKINQIKTDNKKIKIFNEDANIFLLNSTGFNYIDIDPFGSPNFMLDSAIKRLAREGTLAVTATDTSALCGTYPEAGIRKYWAKPLKNELMHEIGLRILIRKVQLIGAQFEKALLPIFSYSKDHYFRIFFQCKKGKKDVDDILKKQKFFLYCNSCLNRKISDLNHEKCDCGEFFDYYGPIFAGKISDGNLIKRMIKNNRNINNCDFLEILNSENEIDGVGFYDIHAVCSKYKISQIPKMETLFSEIRKQNFKFAKTHFSLTGIKSNIDFEKLLKIVNAKNI